MRQQLANAVAMAVKADQIVWAVFAVFAAATPVLIVALFPSGNLASRWVGVAVCVLGLAVSVVWRVVLGRGLLYLDEAEKRVQSLEERLEVPANLSVAFKLGGQSARPVLKGCAVGVILLWLLSLILFLFVRPRIVDTVPLAAVVAPVVAVAAQPQGNGTSGAGSGFLGTMASVFAPLVVGVFLFVTTQAIAKTVIDPALELRRVMGRVAHALVFYANVHANPGDVSQDRMDKAQETYRDLSAELRVGAMSIPSWGMGPLVATGIVPRLGSVKLAAEDLMGLSNGVHGIEQPGWSRPQIADLNMKRADRIRAALRLYDFG